MKTRASRLEEIFALLKKNSYQAEQAADKLTRDEISRTELKLWEKSNDEQEAALASYLIIKHFPTQNLAQQSYHSRYNYLQLAAKLWLCTDWLNTPDNILFELENDRSETIRKLARKNRLKKAKHQDKH